MAMPFWYDPPAADGRTAWDVLILGGGKVPGIARVEARLGRRLDMKKAKGAHGASLTDEGYDPAQITITITIWEREHLDALRNFVAKLRPKSTADPAAVDVVHPQLQFLGITSIFIKEISAPRPVGQGLYDVVFQAIEYMPLPKRGKSASKGVKPDITGLDVPMNTDPTTGVPVVNRRPAPPSKKPEAVKP
jgi:hypothetical protein